MMRLEILELQAMGQMPDEAADDYKNDQICELADKYRTLLETIQKPQNIKEAEILISLFPNEYFFHLEWDLLHCVETIYRSLSEEEVLNLINQCPSKEWKKILLRRVQNRKNKQQSSGE